MRTHYFNEIEIIPDLSTNSNRLRIGRTYLTHSYQSKG